MIGAAHQDGETVARGILSEVFVGDGGVFLQPLLRRERFEGGGELAVDLAPCTLEIGGGGGIGERTVGIRDVDLVQLRVQSFAEAEQGEHAVVDRGEMADEIEETVFAGGNLFLELLVTEWGEGGIETAGDELPGIERRV